MLSYHPWFRVAIMNCLDHAEGGELSELLRTDEVYTELREVRRGGTFRLYERRLERIWGGYLP